MDDKIYLLSNKFSKFTLILNGSSNRTRYYTNGRFRMQFLYEKEIQTIFMMTIA
jgi:hypothetical protein